MFNIVIIGLSKANKKKIKKKKKKKKKKGLVEQKKKKKKKKKKKNYGQDQLVSRCMAASFFCR